MVIGWLSPVIDLFVFDPSLFMWWKIDNKKSGNNVVKVQFIEA